MGDEGSRQEAYLGLCGVASRRVVGDVATSKGRVAKGSLQGSVAKTSDGSHCKESMWICNEGKGEELGMELGKERKEKKTGVRK